MLPDLLAWGLLASSTAASIAHADPPPSSVPSPCADALEGATPLRRLGATRIEWIVEGDPRVVRLEAEAGPCVAVVAESGSPVDLRIAIHASDGELLAESMAGPTSAAVACARPHEVRYAVLRTARTARVGVTRLAGPGLELSAPPSCASRSPSWSRGEIDPGGPPGASAPASPSSSDEASRPGLVERESHRVQCIGGVAVPIPVAAHAGRILAIEARSRATTSIVLVDPSGRVLSSDATSAGTAQLVFRPTSEAILRAYVRSASPSTVRVLEAAP